ncbi:MAG: 30S ribosomal protein S20 [Victivallaceae bacterium]|nr:30S ribosomal protein S20 [Victivallaceae bacterium]
MASSKSAMKRVGTDAQKHLRNKTRKAALKTIEKSFRAAVETKDREKALELGCTCFSKFDKAAKVGAIPKNRAGNKKAQISKLLNSLQG